MNLKVAIDSGWSGAMAVSYKNQIWTVNSGETYKDMFDDIKNIKNFADDEFCTIDCILEKVHVMPKQNVKATWSQCENFTAYQVILMCLGISVRHVTAQAWQKHFIGVPKGKNAYSERKQYFKEQMQAFYPTLKVTKDNADALAILSVFDKL